MAYIGKNPKQNTSTFTPQSADPTNPVEGMVHHSDGTARAEGRWVYQNSAWVKVAEGSAGALVVQSKSATFTALTTEDVYLIDSSSGAVTANLPTAIGNTGKVFKFKKTDSGSNLITIDANSSQTIDGALTRNIVVQYQSIEIISDGTNWIVSHYDAAKVYLKDEKSSGVAGGTFTSGAWQERTLNTVSGDSALVSLTSNKFDLEPGDYEIEADSPGYAVYQHKCKIVEDPSGSPTDLVIGSSERAEATDSTSTKSTLSTSFSISATTTFNLQHRCISTNTVDGFGIPTTGFGVVEVYAQVTIKKIK